MNRNQRSNNPHQGHGRGQQGGNNYQQQQQYFPDYGQGNQGQGQGQQYQQQFYPPGYQQQYQQPYYPQDYYQQQHQQYGGQYNEYEDYNQQYSENPDQLMLEELEREMGGSGEFVPQQHQQQQHSQQAAPQGQGSSSYLPHGAMPSINGKLTKNAAEFWFPECRDCTCCTGYKHGCKCCVGGVTQCSCVSGTPPAPPATTTTTAPTPSSSSPKTGSTSYLPSGAVPSMGGKLTKAAAEFWFPECRNCECCTGYKHGCKCCVGDVTQCSCLNSNVSTDAKDITSTNTSNTQVDDVAASNVTQVEGTLSMKDETPS